jgi:hypothetical protein
MKQTEKILGLLAILALVLKFMLVPGSSILAVLSLSLLALLYQFLSFAFFNNIRLRNIFKKESYRGLTSLRIIGTIVLGFSLAIAVLGILFKFQSYPGASMMLIEGLSALVLCLVVTLIRYSNNKSSNYKRIFSRIAIVGGIALSISLTPRLKLFEILHRNHPAYVQAVKHLDADPDNKVLHDEVEKQRKLAYP